MRVLHVAALPFPSYQGTQAAIKHMLQTMSASGHEVHVLCYPHSGYLEPFPFEIHRPDALMQDRSLRSGPSWRKITQDVRLVTMIRSLASRLKPDVLVAHHVEAAAATLAAGIRPIFVAHTQLQTELPFYVHEFWRPVAAGAGAFLEAFLIKQALACAAISPGLAQSLQDRHGAPVFYLPIPWPVAEPLTQKKRTQARERFGFDAHSKVLLYAGNLDSYQGWELLVPCLEILRAKRQDVQLLVATESATDDLVRQALQHGVSKHLHVTHLQGEAQRENVMASADVVLVPRRLSAGLPVKLLDAMARSVPTVCAQTATAGLDLNTEIHIATLTPDSFAAAIQGVLDDEAAAQAMAARGRVYVATLHSQAVFEEAFGRCCAHIGAKNADNFVI